jgi:excisionase family DNA binding protein
MPLDLLTVKDAAGLLRLSTGAVYALCKSGTLPHHRLGQGRGAIRIDRLDLLHYVEACKTAAAPVGGGGSPAASVGTAAPQRPLPSPSGFKHLRLDRLLDVQRPADGPPSRGGDHSAH